MSVISRALARYRETGSLRRRQGQGRRRITTPREDLRIVLTALRDRMTSAVSIRNEMQLAATTRTVRRRLNASNLNSRRPLRAPYLSLNHRRSRREYYINYQHWTQAEWRRVFFSDESRFSVFQNDGRVRVWRRPGERLHPRCIVPVRSYNGGSLMVWAFISWYEKSPLIVINTPPGLTARRYIDEILIPYVLEARLRRGRNFVFMHDNAPPHKAFITRRFLEDNDITVLEHPSNSPDLNPIEHVWDLLNRKVRTSQAQITNLVQLREALLIAWDEISLEQIRRCINMPERLQAVTRARGGNTRF